MIEAAVIVRSGRAEPAWYLAFGASLALWLGGPSAALAQTCSAASQCQVVGADCIQSSCRLSSPEFLVPSMQLQPIELREPADRFSTENREPSLRFTFPAGARTVSVLITSRPPRYDVQGTLLNPEAVVWFWNSQADNEARSLLLFSMGKRAEASDAGCMAKSAEPLAPGVYYWGALAWDGAGQLTHQSAVRRFSVGPEALTGAHCRTDLDCGGATGKCMTSQNYCVIRCASDADCFSGTTCDLSTATLKDFPWGACRRPGPTCQCTPDQRCDDAPEGLRVCFEGVKSPQAPGAGCDCSGVGGGGSPRKPNPCYFATAAAFVWGLGRRRRRSSRDHRRPR
jgi:MYXO-CTERM domain-containing protein